MAEYIEREALLKKAVEEKRFVFQMEDLLNNEVVFKTVYKDLADFILSAPTADVAPVVRCKECKHEEECMKQLVFWERDHVLEQNVYQYHKLDFCSYGERRADNG